MTKEAKMRAPLFDEDRRLEGVLGLYGRAVSGGTP
jgi:hypothetical protein